MFDIDGILERHIISPNGKKYNVQIKYTLQHNSFENFDFYQYEINIFYKDMFDEWLNICRTFICSGDKFGNYSKDILIQKIKDVINLFESNPTDEMDSFVKWDGSWGKEDEK